MIKQYSAQYHIDENSVLNYYEYYDSKKEKPNLLMLHAQGTDSMSFRNIAKALARHYHLYLVDYYGHGKSSHNAEKYNLVSIGRDIVSFVENVISGETAVLGHSSGGLIAAFAAAHCTLCKRLILEDPPFFSSCGERRYTAYNYIDLSSVCHSFLSQDVEKDFVCYYFINQYCWNFFPEKSREQLRQQLGGKARIYRERHPHKNLKVPFWPKRFLEGFRGMQYYDPRFGEAFYSDSFNASVDYEMLLGKIRCETLFLKAKSTISEDGILQGALSDEDLELVKSLIPKMKVRFFECGHSIHTEKAGLFLSAIVNE